MSALIYWFRQDLRLHDQPALPDLSQVDAALLPSLENSLSKKTQLRANPMRVPLLPMIYRAVVPIKQVGWITYNAILPLTKPVLTKKPVTV